MKTTRPLLWLALLLCAAFALSAATAPAARVLIVVGPSTHPPGSHEVAAGGRLMKHCLENMANVPGVKADVVEGWPTASQCAAASTVVFMGDTFPPNRLPNPKQNLAELDAMMKRGAGIVCVHYATGLMGEDVQPDGAHPLLEWMGGYFAHRTCTHHQSTAKIFPAATIERAAPAHPVSRGWRGFTLNDEPYIHNYLGPAGNSPAPNVTVLATSMLPPEAPKRETVAWCVERADGGRGFGIVMPHFYKNWALDDLRRFILNGVVWTAKLDVPAEGVQTATPDLKAFAPESVEYVPRPPAPKKAAAISPPSWQTPPGWTATRGGEGGRFLRVTTLAASGPGSLAEALAAKEPRVIEFTVGGVIDLGGKSLRLNQPRATIAGETAPEPGITLVNGGLGITTHDVIVRHIRIRPGAGARAKKSGWEVDGLATGQGARDVIVDHCSITWSTDENLSASGPRFEGATPDDWRRNTSHRVTFSHCIIGEGLHDSTHAKGPHSKGSLIHDNATDVLILGNLYISNDDRNPFFKGGARGAVVNNLIHNPGRRVMQFALNPGEWTGHAWQRGAMAVVGNVARKGRSSVGDIAFLDASGPLDAHLADNQFFDAAGRALPATVRHRDAVEKSIPAQTGQLRQVNTPPLWPEGLKARPSGATRDWVLENAGARPWNRDATDRRLVEEARTGGGKIIHHESEAGGR